ncbi:MAG: acylneuraminate cytidylyltransferase family protein [Bdellovibrio sp.]
MKKILAIIPARGGSKRVPGKNKRLFMGKPLIQWTIESALKSPGVTKVVVTTDDEDILNLASLFPQVDFHRRSLDLAMDKSSSIDVVLDVMNKYEHESYDQLLLLQPTSPLRNETVLQRALELATTKNCCQMVSVRRCKEIPSHIMKVQNGYLHYLLDNDSHMRSQDWGELWVLNGAIYLSDWAVFRQTRTFVTDSTVPFEMDDDSSVDIDTEEDWIKAEQIAKSMQRKSDDAIY